MLNDASRAFAFGDMHAEISKLFQNYENVLILEREDYEHYSSPIDFERSSVHLDIRDCSLKAGDDFAVRTMTMRGDPVLRISFRKAIRFIVSYSDSMHVVDEPGQSLLIFRDYNKVCCLFGCLWGDQSTMLTESNRMLKSRVTWANGVLKLKKTLEKG